MENFSNTQLTNYAIMIAGLLVLVGGTFGIVIDKGQAAFIIYALINIGVGAYAFYKRWSKGDITLGGFRIKK